MSIDAFIDSLPPDSTDPLKRMTRRERRVLSAWGWSSDSHHSSHSVWWLAEKDSASECDVQDILNRLLEMGLLEQTSTYLFRRTTLGDETAMRMLLLKEQAKDSDSVSGNFKVTASMLLVGMLLGLGLAMFWMV